MQVFVMWVVIRSCNLEIRVAGNSQAWRFVAYKALQRVTSPCSLLQGRYSCSGTFCRDIWAGLGTQAAGAVIRCCNPCSASVCVALWGWDVWLRLFCKMRYFKVLCDCLASSVCCKHSASLVGVGTGRIFYWLALDDGALWEQKAALPLLYLVTSGGWLKQSFWS